MFLGFESAPIVPISADKCLNVEVVIDYFCTYFKSAPLSKQKSDYTSTPHGIVLRSFDQNRECCNIEEMQGGIMGCSLKQGMLKVSQISIELQRVYFQQFE